MTEQNYSKPRNMMIVIRLNSEDLKMWDKFAKEKDMSRAELIRKSVKTFMKVNKK